jgi:hypothetical protein
MPSKGDLMLSLVIVERKSAGTETRPFASKIFVTVDKNMKTPTSKLGI